MFLGQLAVLAYIVTDFPRNFNPQYLVKAKIP